MTTRTQLAHLLARRILVLDGAMGTMIQRHGLTEADFRGDRFGDHGCDLKGDNDLLVLTRPDVIAGIHDAYLEAGSDLVIVTAGSSARLTSLTTNAPIDLVIVGVIDSLEIGGAVVYRKQ